MNRNQCAHQYSCNKYTHNQRKVFDIIITIKKKKEASIKSTGLFLLTTQDTEMKVEQGTQAFINFVLDVFKAAGFPSETN